MKKGSGDVDPMIPGKKMECVFGFCDIRNFTDVTEVLQEEVMAFVNEIAHIVHTTVYHYSGAANKNTGDAFLLVWKLPSSINSETMDLSLLSERHFARQLADMAVMSFMKIWANIHKNPKILKYRQNPSLTKRMPNFSVKMGFGLHAGWAIEGAIGSEYKIDASYLSPHVNMASRLEAATKQYGVPILVSGKVYQLVTSLTRKILRQIDRVRVKGSQLPVDLYTPDLNIEKLQPEAVRYSEEAEDKKTTKLKMMELRDTLKKSIIKEKRMITYLYREDPDFILMLDDDLWMFRKKFEEGFEAYLEGKWAKAKELFEEAERNLGKTDGPCRTLIAVIDDSQGEAPKGWPGYRELTEK
jgi:class 3 adenylate cyclase